MNDSPAYVAHLEDEVRRLTAQIGSPPDGSHPDEALPRDVTWHRERLNWIAEVERLRAEVERLSVLR